MLIMLPEEEENAVRQLGDLIGYDRVIQIAQQIGHPGYAEISQTIDGEWRTPPREAFYRACCDCALVHKEEYRIQDGRVQYRVKRDREETRLERLRTGKNPAPISRETKISPKFPDGFSIAYVAENAWNGESSDQFVEPPKLVERDVTSSDAVVEFPRADHGCAQCGIPMTSATADGNEDGLFCDKCLTALADTG